MAENSAIEWTHHTFNPVLGCQKVGPGCDHCYAEGWAKRSGLVAWGPGETRRVTSDTYWRQPLKWDREAKAAGEQRRVFCASLADVFDNAWPDGVRDRLWTLIKATPNLDWMLLTKRPGNIAKMLPDDWGTGYQNVWLGCTIVNQEEADRDIPKLLAVPAGVRFLSMEPLLGPVDLTRICLVKKLPSSIRAGIHVNVLVGRYVESGRPYVDWDIDQPYSTASAPLRLDLVIVGGESGPGARPMHQDWARSLRDQCVAAGTAFHFKQWGEYLPTDRLNDLGIPHEGYVHPDGAGAVWPRPAPPAWGEWGPYKLEELGFRHMTRVGKKAAGRELDGRT